ncbi:head-tail adaptor protein [Altericroceibacterium spongiae]|uniref:Head-tail adaptor protein n=1 Tax=Altericroceibacterium spongiae TaxID=2320269 RepID=A0A420ERP3_9SPHN|nr:phage head closure protein [Altericroceibacterium spongiae]RKF23374.1 head-tail adaptor protein [Altericroceibacterium spongiae]
MLSAGPIHKRIEIHTQQLLREDDFGSEIYDWAEDKKRWARIIYGTGQERRQAAQESATQPATIVMRHDSYTAAITTDAHRLFFDGVAWDIESIVKRKRDGEVSITATSRTG